MVRTLTRAVAFHARHRYFRPEWSEAMNRERFGWTSEAPGHGHLYRIEVSVSGPPEPGTGMVIDLRLLDAILEEELLTPLGGAMLNEAIPELDGREALPCCEALAAWCWTRIERRLPSSTSLQRIRVAEDDTLWAECTSSK